jgi:hypothetical protein
LNFFQRNSLDVIAFLIFCVYVTFKLLKVLIFLTIQILRKTSLKIKKKKA